MTAIFDFMIGLAASDWIYAVVFASVVLDALFPAFPSEAVVVGWLHMLRLLARLTLFSSPWRRRPQPSSAIILSLRSDVGRATDAYPG